MSLRSFFIVYIVFINSALVAQADSILSLPRDQQKLAVCDIYGRLINDHPKRADALNNLLPEFQKKNRDDLIQMITFMLWKDSADLMPNGTAERKLDFWNKRLHIVESKNWPSVENEARFKLGQVLFDDKKFGPGMEMMIKSYEELNKNGWSSPFSNIQVLQDLGHAFYHFGDYASAISYLKATQKVNIPSTNRGFSYKNLNSIGLCYRHMHQPDSAIYYFTQSYQHAKLVGDTYWMGLTQGNMGDVYYETGEYEKAEPYLIEDYKAGIEKGVLGSSILTSLSLATIELKKGNLQQAEDYLHFARTNIDTSALDAMVIYYENLFFYHKLKGDSKNATLYADSLIVFKKRKDSVFDKHILDQAEMKVAVARYDSSIKLLQAARSRQILMRNSLFIILILTSLIALLWIKRSQLKRQTAIGRLAEAEEELKRYTKSLLEKNEQIKAFTDQTAQIPPDRSADISELTHLSILTEEDWKHFRKLFDTVYPGFLVRLREKINDLTPAETRLLALTKLQISSSDMASMLGISAGSIRTSRYRLRKKLNLPEEGSLEELVEMV